MARPEALQQTFSHASPTCARPVCLRFSVAALSPDGLSIAIALLDGATAGSVGAAGPAGSGP